MGPFKWCLYVNHVRLHWPREVVLIVKMAFYLFFQKLGGIRWPFSLYVCCVFWPAFGCSPHPKAGWTTFFGRFQPPLFILNLFQWFHAWNQEKTCFFLFSEVFGWFQAWNHWKRYKIKKRLKMAEKNQFDQLSGLHSTQKLVKIHNICAFQIHRLQWAYDTLWSMQPWHTVKGWCFGSISSSIWTSSTEEYLVWHQLLTLKYQPWSLAVNALSPHC